MASPVTPPAGSKARRLPTIAVLVAGTLGGCALPPMLQDPDVQRFLVEKSAEIGSQDARVFELKIEAAQALIARALELEDPAAAGAGVRDALNLLE